MVNDAFSASIHRRRQIDLDPGTDQVKDVHFNLLDPGGFFCFWEAKNELVIDDDKIIDQTFLVEFQLMDF